MKKTGLWFLFVGAILFSPLSLPAAQTLQVRLRDSGRVIWEKPIPESASFILRHVNSIYDARVEERFQVEPGGTIRLTAVRTPSPAVLEYYGLETPSAGWVPVSRTFEKLHLLVSTGGKVCLLVEQQTVDLSRILPNGTRIEIRADPGNRKAPPSAEQ